MLLASAIKHASFPRTSKPRSMPSVPGLHKPSHTSQTFGGAIEPINPNVRNSNFIKASTPFNAQFSATKRGGAVHFIKVRRRTPGPTARPGRTPSVVFEDAFYGSLTTVISSYGRRLLPF